VEVRAMFCSYCSLLPTDMQYEAIHGCGLASSKK
jgi:hypothetical protein